MRRRHEGLRLGRVHAREFGMQRDAQLVAALIVLDQTDQGADGRIVRRGVEFFRRI